MDTSITKGISGKEIVTVGELAELLQVPRSWVYGQTRCAENSGFPLIRVGKYVRFNPLEVLDWLRSHGTDH